MVIKRPGSLAVGGLCALLFLSGCSTVQEAEVTEEELAQEELEEEIAEVTPLRILCPSGAPALATLGLYDLADTEIEYTQGQDELIAQLARKDSEYDIIIAPVNLGVKSFEENEAWHLDSILTWGNLYILGEEEWDEEGKTIDLFGQNAVPGLVFGELFPDLAAGDEWFPSVADAGSSYLVDDAAAVLLAMPQAKITQDRAAEQDRPASIVADLQVMWTEKFETQKEGYPQAALFIREDSDSAQMAVDAVKNFLGENMEAIQDRIEEVGAEKLGAGSVEIAVETWDQQHISFEYARDVLPDLEVFLDLFGLKIEDGFIIE